MKKFKYQLVLQFECVEIADWDNLVRFEEQLLNHIHETAFVDGHDSGCGEFNIFILTDQPVSAFEMSESLRRLNLPDSSPVAAYRELLGEEYILLWPPGQTHFNIM